MKYIMVNKNSIAYFLKDVELCGILRIIRLSRIDNEYQVEYEIIGYSNNKTCCGE